MSNPSKPVVNSMRVPHGKVMVEFRKGLASSEVEAALLQALEMLRGKRQDAA
ncbi:hypothetical protein EP7_005557 (plasmid) [Isosphaeraceae bacterium EP7]